MDRPTPQPLSVTEAKLQLQQAAERVDVGNLIQRHPYGSLALGFLFGAVLGKNLLKTAPLLVSTFLPAFWQPLLKLYSKRDKPPAE